jgi:chromosome segregation ATPase
MEAIMERRRDTRFGAPNGADPAAAGQASGVSRRLKRLIADDDAQLEEMIRRPGMAGWKAYEEKMRRQQHLEEARVDCDRVVQELRRQADHERATLLDLAEKVNELREWHAELEAQCREQEAKLEELIDLGEQLRQRVVKT